MKLYSDSISKQISSNPSPVRVIKNHSSYTNSIQPKHKLPSNYQPRHKHKTSIPEHFPQTLKNPAFAPLTHTQHR